MRVGNVCCATGAAHDVSVNEAQQGDHADGDGDDIAVVEDVVLANRSGYVCT